ncbi:YtxH domain-containing protein [Enterococcus nangangensis]
MIKNFLKGLLFGGSLGSLLGLLLAPVSGNETREKLKSQLDEASLTTLELEKSLKNFQRSAVQLKETVTTLLEPFAKETQQSLADFQFQAAPRIAQIQEQIAKIQAELPQESTSKKFVRYYLPHKKARN